MFHAKSPQSLIVRTSYRQWGSMMRKAVASTTNAGVSSKGFVLFFFPDDTRDWSNCRKAQFIWSWNHPLPWACRYLHCLGTSSLLHLWQPLLPLPGELHICPGQRDCCTPQFYRSHQQCAVRLLHHRRLFKVVVCILQELQGRLVGD